MAVFLLLRLIERFGDPRMESYCKGCKTWVPTRKLICGNCDKLLPVILAAVYLVTILAVIGLIALASMTATA